MSNTDNMHGKIVLITGGTGGIGKATATGIAKLGATTVIVGRDRERGESAVAEIKNASGNPQVDLILADLASQVEVRKVACEFAARYDRLNVLINNVGALFGKRRETDDGIEATLAINYLCPFLLSHLLLPVLKASVRARIVNVNSEGHRASKEIAFDDLQTQQWKRGFPVYSQAKLANLMFTYELARRLSGTGITVNALDPGIVDTNLVKRFIAERFFPNNKYLSRLATFLVRQISHLKLNFCDTDTAARPSIYLASAAEVEGLTGKYFNNDNQPFESSPASYDETAAQRLWRVSAKLTGLKKTNEAYEGNRTNGSVEDNGRAPRQIGGSR